MGALRRVFTIKALHFLASGEGREREGGEMKCSEKATHRFTWPGKDESFICGKHLQKLQSVARAIGMNLQTIPVHESEHAGEECRQASKPGEVGGV